MKIFIQVSEPISNDLISEIESFVNENSSLNVTGKIIIHDWEEDNQTAWIELPQSEAMSFVSSAHEFGDLQCYDGEPKFKDGFYINCL